jgi:acetyl-CoA C-acetyltransferase
MSKAVFVLGGHQTDFAKNYAKADKDIYHLIQDAVPNALHQANVNAADIEAIHVGNFVGELFCGQGQLGGLVANVNPHFHGLPTMRHEAACASGSMAILSAMADIQSGRYDVVLVTGIEMMRNVNGKRAAEYLGSAAWINKEGQDADFPWPYLFDQIADFYKEKHGLQYEHLQEIAKTNFQNAKHNPLAQTREWQTDDNYFSQNDEYNPIIEGNLRKSDCGRITDGCVVIVLASESYTKKYCQSQKLNLDNIPQIKGWGHHTAPMLLKDKLDHAHTSEYPFPWLKKTVDDALHRAGLTIDTIDLVETHDCFSISEYVALDHLGLHKVGEAWKAIEDETITMNGKLPINPSGGLLANGHPVGATGVRMVLDSYKQCTGQAGDYQVNHAKQALTINIGGSLTSMVSFVVGVN